MKVGILGTGGVGKAFANRLTELGHKVMLGTRDVQATLSKKENGLKDLLEKNKNIQMGSFAETAAFGDLVLNVGKGEHALEIVKAAAQGLKEKILVDISNPLEPVEGSAPILVPGLSNNNSLGEAIQKLLPDTKVVKTLNTMWNGIMVNPAIVNGGDHVNFICGNDAIAKSKVVELLKQMGWKEASILDLGDITGARGMEGILPLWLRIYGSKKTGAFNFKIVS